jgi:hypothetical protein
MPNRMASIVFACLFAAVGLAIGEPARAQDSNFAKPVVTAPPKPATTALTPAKKPIAQKPAAKKTDIANTDAAAAAPAAADPPLAAGRKGAAKTKGARSSPTVESAVPDSIIRSDLAWFGDDEDLAAADFDERAAAIIKAFQKRNGGKETGVLTDEQRALLTAAVKSRKEAVGWRLIDDDATGARVGVPEKLVSKSSTTRTGSHWSSAQGQVQVETFRLREASISALFDQEKRTPRGRRVGTSVLKADSFYMAGEQGLKKFVERVQANGTELRGISILYDLAIEGTMDRMASVIANAFQGFPDPNAAPPGRKRSVEYSTAIVVSGQGDLLAASSATDECQAIEISGLGHAARVAEDRSSDLALLRLYGAQNLVAASIAGDSGSNSSTQLKLVGVADPLAQAGGAAVTSVPAQATAQGIDPAPKPGFSGAAAVDAQSRFAGVVTLKTPAVAGTGSVNQQAALIPAATVRAFLSAQGITTAVGNAAIDQSIVRVICVRK